MDWHALVLRTSVAVFMLGSLLGVGLAVTPRQALTPLGHRRFVMLTLVVGWVVGPAVAWLMLEIVALDRPYAVGLLLLALAPAAPFAPAMMQAARADSAYTAGFMILTAVATVAIMPIAVPLLVAGVAVEPQAIARPLVLFVLLPLLLGLITRQIDRDLADRVRRPVAIITNAAGLVLLIVVGAQFGRGVLNAVGSYAIATQLVYVGVVTVLAHVLGAGLQDDKRSVLTLGMCSRNLGAALAPLAVIESDARAIVMIAIAAPVTLAWSVATARWLARHRSDTAKA